MHVRLLLALLALAYFSVVKIKNRQVQLPELSVRSYLLYCLKFLPNILQSKVMHQLHRFFLLEPIKTRHIQRSDCHARMKTVFVSNRNTLHRRSLIHCLNKAL